MKNLKSHFRYNKRQRNGIFFLLLLIIVFQGIYFFVDVSSENTTTNDLSSKEIALFQKKVNELKLVEIKNRKPRKYPFNPSFITDFKGEQLGMSIIEMDRLLKHRANGKYINSIKHFQKLTGVSDSLLAVISPNFKFPEWISKKNKRNISKKTDVTFISNKNTFSIEKIDLNKATIEELQNINGIGVKLSKRIVKYRNSLKGFLSDDQLNEVYGLKSEVIGRILEHFTVLSKPSIKKVNVNTATFKEVLCLPHIDYELTLKIFQHRDEVAELQSIDELKNIEDFPLELFDKIIVYLEAK